MLRDPDFVDQLAAQQEEAAASGEPSGPNPRDYDPTVRAIAQLATLVARLAGNKEYEFPWPDSPIEAARENLRQEAAEELIASLVPRTE